MIHDHHADYHAARARDEAVRAIARMASRPRRCIRNFACATADG